MVIFIKHPYFFSFSKGLSNLEQIMTYSSIQKLAP